MITIAGLYIMCRYIPLTLIEQTDSTEQVNTSEDQIHATEEQLDATIDGQTCTTNIPLEQVCTPEEQINVADDPDKVISKDQGSTQLGGEGNRKRGRDESSSPDTLSPSNYTCIESDPASESVIDLTQDSP